MDEKINLILEEQYSLLEGSDNRAKSQLLYNIIKAKVEFKMRNYHQSLYLDVKLFLRSYILAAENQDFGYDKVRLSKIQDVVELLPKKQKLYALQTARRRYLAQSYDIDDINSLIKKQEMVVAWDSRNYIKYFSLKIGSDLKSLLWGYFVYAVVTMLILLPAPFRWMAIFDIELKKYSSSPF